MLGDLCVRSKLAISVFKDINFVSDLWFINVSHTLHKMSSFVEHREINVLFIFLFITGNSFACALGQRDNPALDIR